ncbi:DUF4167 domain-containing protein [Rickettsiales bacterium]|nr:DUF4167 domain-containing protein [Rickettsiales bacterium]
MIVKKTPNIRRRNRSNGRRSNFSRNGFDNSNPHRPKGSVSKILEKYINLAQDAASNGDRIKAEGFYQHAEHYQRILNTMSNDDTKNKENQTKISHNNDKTMSRTDRAIMGTKERLEKKSDKESSNGEDRNIVDTDDVVTPDGVEALKAFTSPVIENKEN